MEIVNTILVKKKFATLLEKLVLGCSLNYEVIEEKIITDPYFCFLENGGCNNFLSQSYSSIINKLFNMEIIFDEEVKYSPIYWAGMEYMNIVLNTFIPLQTVILLCPLKEMINNYSIYHEMNDIKLVDKFLKENYQRSIIKTLAKKRGISIPTLSKLTNISVTTLRYLVDNQHLYKTTFININQLVKIFKVSDSIFKEHADISYFPHNILEDKVFAKCFISEINYYLKDPININKINNLKLGISGLSYDLNKKNKTVEINDAYLKSSLFKTLKKVNKENNLIL